MVLPPLEGDLSKSLLLNELFDYLYKFAEECSPRDIFKSAGMLIGRNPKGEIVVLVAPNGVPLALEQNGIMGEDGFQGERLDGKTDNATVHFETHLMLAAALFEPLRDVILIGSDPMCPPCSNNVSIFAQGKNFTFIHDAAAKNRPISQNRVCNAFEDVSLRRLQEGGVMVVEYNEGAIQTRKGNLRTKNPVKTSDHMFTEHLIRRLYTEKSKPFAMLVKPDRTFILCEAAHDLRAGNYNGQDMAVINPLTSVLIEGARRGIDLTQCNAVLIGCHPGVNCALTAVTSQVGRLDIFSDTDISDGAENVLNLGMAGRTGKHAREALPSYKPKPPHPLKAPSPLSPPHPGISGSSRS